MGPYDYTSAFNGLGSSYEAAMQGLKGGVAIADVQAQRAQQARDLAAQQQKRATIQALVDNPNATADDYAKATLLVPELHAQFKQAWDTKSTAQQQNELRQLSQWSAAIQSGQPKIASDAMRAQADAIENTAGSPTQESRALRAKADQVDANPQASNFILKSMIAANPLGKGAIDGIVALGGEQRAADLAPGAVRKGAADADSAEAKSASENLGIVAQKAGALAQAKSVKPAQAETMFRTLAAQGRIPKTDLQGYLDGIPTDAAAVPDYLRQVQASGLSAADQTKYTTPDANTVANNDRIAAEGAANRANQVKVTQMVSDREAGGDDAASFTKEAIDNAAARYNLDGTLPPMGMGKAAAAGRTKILNRAAELKAGVDPEQQRRDQLNNKAGIANQNKAIRDFNTGKQGNAVRSFNVLLSHLDTLDSLSDALDNGNIQAINRLGNAYAKATGKAAPTNFDAVKHIVGDELVKAITGGAGALGDRESIAKTIDSVNSPSQLKGVIKNFKELAVGQLGGLETQYRTSTGLNDFEHLLSPAARLMRNQHGGAPSPAGGKVVDFGSLK